MQYLLKKIIFALYYICAMRRTIITFAAIVCATCFTGVVWATSPEISQRRSDIEELLERNRWGEARAMLKQLRKDVDKVKDKYDLEWIDYHYVRCAVELDIEDADGMMQQYMQQYPASVYANRMQFLLGSYYCDRGNLEAAYAEFMKVDYMGLDAREKERYDVRMGYIYFVQDDYSAAYTHFKQINKHSDYYTHALYYMSYIDYREGRYVEAKQGFTALKEREPYRNLAPYYLLQIEYRYHNYDYVIEHGEKLIVSAAGSVKADLARIIAECYFKRADYNSAYKYMSLYPESLMSRQENYIMGYSLYRQAQYKEAIAPLNKVCGVDDALTQNASYHLGDCYLRCGDKSNAASAFAMAANSGEDATIAEDALLNYGRLKFELGGGLFNESVNVLQSYIEQYPESEHIPEVKSLLIAAYYNSKNYDAAYAAIKEFDNPDNEIRAALQKVATLRAVEAVRNGDLETADNLLLEAERIGLNAKYDALVLYWQGEIAYRRGDMELAKQKYEEYALRAPKNEVEYAFANYGIGYCNFAQDKMKEAAEAFEVFVRSYNNTDEYLYDGHNRLGDSYYATRDFGAARRAYNISASAKVAHLRDYARYQLAMVDGIESKTRSKIDRLNDIISDDDSEYKDDAWYELGRTYIAAERYADGAATLQKFVSADTLSPYYIPALSDLGLAYFNLGRKGDARSCYEKVVDYDPLSASAMEAMRGIREIYVAENNLDGYFAYAERCGVQSDMSAAARDSLSFAVAKNAYLEGDMKGAGEKLQKYLKDFKKGYNRTEALFYLSDYYVLSGDDASAIKTMSELVEQGNTQYTERVLRVLAPMAFENKMYDKSSDAYRKLYDITTKDDIRQLASEGYVEATLCHATSSEIKALVDDVAAMEHASQWAVRHSLLAKAHVLSDEGNMEEALAIYEELSKERMTEEGAESYYHLIEAKYNSGDYAVAEQMVYKFGDSGSMYWQAKAFILLGDILVKMDNTFQARATYQSIVDGYSPADDGIVEEAKQRIKALK